MQTRSRRVLKPAGGPTLSDGVLSNRLRRRGAALADGRAALGQTPWPPRGAARLRRDALPDDAFDLGFADAVEPSRMALVSVDGGDDWHPRRERQRHRRDGPRRARADGARGLRAAGILPGRPCLGWSMGGFGALLIAGELGPLARQRGRRRQRLHVAAGQPDARPGLRRAREPQLFRRSIFNSGLDLLRKASPGPSLDCLEQVPDPFIAARNRELSPGAFPGAETHFTEGGHDDAFWGGNVPAEMAWAAAHSWPTGWAPPGLFPYASPGAGRRRMRIATETQRRHVGGENGDGDVMALGVPTRSAERAEGSERQRGPAHAAARYAPRPWPRPRWSRCRPERLDEARAGPGRPPTTVAVATAAPPSS